MYCHDMCAMHVCMHVCIVCDVCMHVMYACVCMYACMICMRARGACNVRVCNVCM